MKPRSPDPLYGVVKSGLVTYRAWFYPNGSKSWDEELLGEFLSEDEARRACDEHERSKR